LLLYKSYANFEINNTFNVLKGQVPEFKKSDIEIAYMVDGVKASSFPLGHIYDVEVDCNGTATAEWIDSGWYLKIRNATAEKVKCTINFTKREITTFADYIFNLAETDTTNLAYDDTSDSNLRYIGSDPNNYLCFDEACTNGKWRVIGVMNNMTTSLGNTESLVKIRRAESIGNYAWDSNGTNDWTTASLNTYLNETWYTSNLIDYDNLIESVVWKLGGYSTSYITTGTLYAYERNKVVYSGSPTEWTGKLALMYPSDYGYATSGGDAGRDLCLSYNLGNYNSYSNCYGNDYLYLGSNEWMLTPVSSNSDNAFRMGSSGRVNYGDSVANPFMVHPSGYLKTTTKIISGNGTSDSPWIIGYSQ
jgi:hypothetical protein